MKNIKKLLVVALVATLVMSFTGCYMTAYYDNIQSPAPAAMPPFAPPNVADAPDDSPAQRPAMNILAVGADMTVGINGVDLHFAGAAPAIIDGIAFVPARDLFESMGFAVGWDGNAGQLVIAGDGVILITLGNSYFTLNGTTHELPAPAKNIDGVAMLPIRAIMDALGYDVYWESQPAPVNKYYAKKEYEDKKDKEYKEEKEYKEKKEYKKYKSSDKKKEYVKKDSKKDKTPAPVVASGVSDVSAQFVGHAVVMHSAQNGRYVSARRDTKNSPLRASANRADSWERFHIVAAGNGYVALRAEANGRYISAVRGDKNVPLRAVAKKVNSWERFRIFEYNENYYLQASNGKWVQISGNDLRANASNRGSSTRLTITKK